MDDDQLRAASDAIVRACADLHDRDPEQADRFDALLDQNATTLTSSPFGPGPETVQITYGRVDNSQD